MLQHHLQAPMMRLITSSLGVLARVNDGTLFNHLNTKDRDLVIDALDKLEQDTELAVKSLPKEISPFMRYRMEVLSKTPAGIMLRSLVQHLSGDQDVKYFDIARCLQELNTHHANIALELVQGFAINPHDPTFLTLIDSVNDTVDSLEKNHG